MCMVVLFGKAQVSRTVEIHMPGTLMFEIYQDLKTVTDLTVTGSLNAIDFRIIRDSMPALKNLDLKAVMIEQYTGTEGTNSNSTNPTFPFNYKTQEIPKGAFNSKTNFETVILPDSARSIASNSFNRFKARNPINIPKGMSSIGTGFVLCATPFTVDPENISYSAIDGVLYNKLQTQLIQVPIIKTGTYTVPTTVTTINSSAMNGCDSLLTVYIPQSVTNIMGAVFNNCSAQINVDTNNTTYSSINGVLFNKTQTTLIQVPISKTGNYKIPATVTSVNPSSFSNCKNITSVSIPQSVTSIGGNAFGNCTALSIIRILTPTPPVITDAVFQNVNTETCTLQVSGGTADAYKAATGWKNFKNIVEAVSTNPVTSVTFTSAVLNGEILHLGSTPVTSYGFCWSTSDSPTITDNKIDKGEINTTGAFNHTLSNLTEGTIYYVRAYTIDSLGIQYAKQVSFTTQSIPDAAGLISGAATVCQGQQNVTYSVPVIKNATSYMWTLPAGAVGISTTNSITVNYEKSAESGDITVKGHNEYNDGTPSSLAITVNPLPVNPGVINGNSSVCIGDSSIVYAVSPVDNATSYIWTLPVGVTGTSTTNTISVKFTKDAVSGDITVKGHNDCGDGVLSTLLVTVNTLPVFTVSDKTVTCGETVTLANSTDFVGSENLKFKWTPATGLDNDTILNPTTVAINNITYTVTVTNANGCSASASMEIKIKAMDKPQIGIVGVNGNNKNVVVWNKPVSYGIDSYSVYRETNVSDVYEKIGTIPYGDLSVFVDETSNPTVKSNKYKLSIVDKNGLETQLSEPHKTMHLSINKGQNNTWNLIWEPYTGFTPSTYNIYRGSSATSLGFIDATSGSSTQFSDISAPTGDVFYQVEVISPVLVNPTRVKSTQQKIIESGNISTVSYNSSRSNIASNFMSGIDNLKTENNNIHVYPNPAKGQFKIECAGGSVFEIQNLIGQLIYTGNLNNSNIVRTDNFKSGVYLIKINIGKSIVNKKVIVE